LTPGSGIREGKKTRSGSGMKISGYISKSLEAVFWVKILKFFYVDPEPEFGIWNLFDPGSGIQDPG
jgi:hypothetical protein